MCACVRVRMSTCVYTFCVHVMCARICVLECVYRCILDGELAVWDTVAERFEEFGKLKSLGECERYVYENYGRKEND